MVDTVRMKRPPFPPAEDDPTGRVRYDDRGNAVWQWKDDDTFIEQMEHPRLSIIDEGEPHGPTGIRRVDGEAGYDPYGSGLVDTQRRSIGRKDLRALSKWIELKRRRGEPPKR